MLHVHFAPAFVKGDRSYVLEPAEELELARRGQAGDLEARNRVVMGLRGLIWTQAFRKAMGIRSRAEEYFQVAVQVLCDKFHLFEPQRGLRFSTWAMFWVNQSIDRYRYKHARTIRLPDHLQDGSKQNEKIRQKRAVAVQAIKRLCSLDAPLTFDRKPTSLAAVLAADQAGPGDEAQVNERRAFVRRVMTRLHPRYRAVLEMTMHGAILAEIGAAMGFTRERARQLQMRALVKFRREAERMGRGIVLEIKREAWESKRFTEKAS